MYYNFMISGKELHVFYNDMPVDMAGKTAGTVSFWFHGNGKTKEYVRTVHKDAEGNAFFTWDKKKIYMHDFKAYSPSELVKKSQEDKIKGEDICHTLMKYGMDSLILKLRTKKLERVNFGGFSLGFITRGSCDKPEDFDWVKYSFVEDYLHMPKDCYKFKLVPATEEDKEIYGVERYYVDDLASLICKNADFELSES